MFKENAEISQLFFAALITGGTFALSSEFALADSLLIRNPASNHWYQRFDNSMSWYAAKSFCERRAGYLATITSQAENNFVWINLAFQSPNAGGTWLGATNDKNGVYKWITGEQWSYVNWNAGTGEPNNSDIVSGGSEHYLMFFPAFMISYEPITPGSWNDIGVYNQGTLWNEGQANYPTAYRPVSTICEWGGQLSSTNF